jgi:hypothetical protein
MDKIQVEDVDAVRKLMKLLWSGKVHGVVLPAEVEEDRCERGK